MAKARNKQQVRLVSRRDAYDRMVQRSNTGGREFTKPGSMNAHKGSEVRGKR